MNTDIPQQCEYPHLHRFLIYKSEEAYKIREARQLLDEFGLIESDDNRDD